MSKYESISANALLAIALQLFILTASPDIPEWTLGIARISSSVFIIAAFLMMLLMSDHKR